MERQGTVTGAAGSTDRERGRLLSEAIRYNLEGFWAAVAERGLTREQIYGAALENEDRLPADARGELAGTAEGAGLPYRDLLAFTLFEETVMGDGCTVGIAAGAAAESGDTVFFKQSDKEGAAEYIGENYHRHQQINVVRVERPDGLNGYVGVTAAGSTAVKMGLNDQGVAIGSNFAHTTTFDENETDVEERAAVSRGEYMRQGLLHGDTAVEVAQHVSSLLLSEPMTSPGNIDVADATRAIVLEGEATHLASEWVEDDVIARTNKFKVLDDLASPEEEIQSSHRRLDRVREVLHEWHGSVTVETMRDLSVDHANGPGPHSICRHRETDHTDPTSLSAAVFDLDGENPARSVAYLALGTPCHAWRSDAGDGWLRVTPTVTEDDVPDRFLSGDAWLDHYAESAVEGEPPSDELHSSGIGPGP